MKIYEYRSSLRKLICKLCIFFTNKNVRSKLKILVAFLSNRRIEGQLDLVSHPFSQNRLIKTKRKPFSKTKIIIRKFRFDYSFAEGQNKNINSKCSEINLEKQN